MFDCVSILLTLLLQFHETKKANIFIVLSKCLIFIDVAYCYDIVCLEILWGMIFFAFDGI